MEEDAEYHWRESEIYGLDVSSGAVTRLTNHPGPDSGPVPSPDGSMIAYAATAGEGNRTDIWVMNTDGSNKRQLTTHPDDDLNPRWTPDGSHVYFSTRRNGTWDIAMVPVDGGDVRVVHQTPMNVFGQTLSPDGSMFYFGAVPTDNQIVTVDVEHLLQAGD